MSKALPDLILRHRYWLTALASLLSSLILVMQRIVVNTDGVVYLAAAQAFLDEGLSGAIAINPNFFLAVLIAGFSSLTGFNLLLSADIINALLHAGLSISFVWLVQQLGGTARMQVIAAVLILLHPSLTGFRDSIFRDPGYWMCCLLSLGLLLQLARQPRQYLIVLWTLALVFGSLFRPEAVFFFVAPLIFLLDKSTGISERLKLLIHTLAIPTGIIVLVVLCFAVTGNSILLAEAAEHLGRYIDYSGTTFDNYGVLIDNFNSLSPFEYPEDMVWLGLILLLAPMLISAMIGSMGDWPILVLFVICNWKEISFNPHQRMFTAYCVIALMVCVCFLGLTFFITTRYTTLLSLFFLALLPAALEKWFAKVQPARWIRPSVTAAIIILLIDTFHSFGHSTAYRKDGVDWVNANTPADSLVISNERNLTYSFDRAKAFQDSEAVFGGWIHSDMQEVLGRYDYFVEDVFWDEEPLTPARYPQAEEVARFTSERGNRLIIYRLP